MTLELEFENQLLIRQLRSLHTQMLEEEDLNKKKILMEKWREKSILLQRVNGITSRKQMGLPPLSKKNWFSFFKRFGF